MIADGVFTVDGIYSDAIYEGFSTSNVQKINNRAIQQSSNKAMQQMRDGPIQRDAETNLLTEQSLVPQPEPEPEEAHRSELHMQYFQKEAHKRELQHDHQREEQRDRAVMLSLEHRLRKVLRRRKTQQRKLVESIRNSFSGSRHRDDVRKRRNFSAMQLWIMPFRFSSKTLISFFRRLWGQKLCWPKYVINFTELL